MAKKDIRFKVVGPVNSPQTGKVGTFVSRNRAGIVYPHVNNPHARFNPAEEIVTLRLDGEDRNRNFKLTDLAQE